MSKSRTRKANIPPDVATLQRSLLDLLPAAVTVTLYDGTLVYVNQRVKDEFGLEIGRKIQDYYENVGDRENIIELIRQRGNLDSFEIPFRRSNGTRVWVLASSRKFEFEGHEAVLSSLVDVTAHRQAEERIAREKENFQKIFSAAPVGLLLLDKDAVIMRVNQAMGEIIMRDPAEIIAKRVGDGLRCVYSPEHPDGCGFGESCSLCPFLRGLENVLSNGASVHGEEIAIDLLISGQPQQRWMRINAEPVEIDDKKHVIVAVDDITESKKIKDALIEGEQRLRSMFENHGAIMFLIDPDSRQIIDANLAAQKFYGYSINALKQMKIDDINAWSLEDMTNFRAQVRREPLNTFLFRHRLANGEIRMVEAYSSFIEVGEKNTLFLIIHDITERQRAEEKLAAHAGRMEVLHAMEYAITSTLAPNQILELLVGEIVKQLHVDACALLIWNPQTDQLEFAAKEGFHTAALDFAKLRIGTGLAGRVAEKRMILSIANLQKNANVDPILVKAIQGEGFISYVGVPLIAKDKLLGVLEIFHRTKLSPESDWLEFLDTLASQAAISIDNARLLEITKQSLKETNALYSINQYLIATIDQELLMTNVVDLLQKSFGFYYVQIFIADQKTGNFMMRAGSGEIGQKLKSQGYFLSPGEGIVGFTAETGKPFLTNNVDEVISFVRTPYLSDTKSELAIPIKIGDQFLGLLDVHQVPPSLLTERDVQLVSAIADQLAVAMQKARMYADLQEALHHEQEARTQLIQTEKLTLSGRLLASVSHELNNPIQAIQNALFLLKEERGISTQGKQDLDIVLSETDRMAALLERLRATYQPASRDEFQLIQINDLIEDIFALLATHLRHNSISYAYLADPDLPAVFGLENQLRQVFLNLMMNAVDAMAGGGHLTVATQFQSDSDEVLIKITDTGTGIDEAIFPNIFDAFVTNKERGTGLGLAISYEIILKHQGRIKAENNPDGGATFSIWLPVNAKGEK